jgi:hypothetical protein
MRWQSFWLASSARRKMALYSCRSSANRRGTTPAGAPVERTRPKTAGTPSGNGSVRPEAQARQRALFPNDELELRNEVNH